jgi:hypothetical protein
MKIDLEFAEVATPLFLAGKNCGLKLDNTKFPGMGLVYDQTEKELQITYNGRLAIIPTSNVVSMIPGGGGPTPMASVPQIQVGETVKHKAKISAQVSTPMGHVFGEGPGHTGRG